MLTLSIKDKTKIIDDIRVQIFERLNHENFENASTRISIISRCMNTITAILNSYDPLKTLRLAMVHQLSSVAKFQPLIPKEQATIFMTTTDLIPHALKIIELDPLMKSAVIDMEIDPNNLEQFQQSIQEITWVHSLYINMFNYARQYLEPKAINEVGDWFLTCMTSLTISYEEKYRNLLGLPSILNQNLDLSEQIIIYQSWYQIIDENFIDVKDTWETLWLKKFNEISPLAHL